MFVLNVSVYDINLKGEVPVLSSNSYGMKSLQIFTYCWLLLSAMAQFFIVEGGDEMMCGHLWLSSWGTQITKNLRLMLH